MDRETTVVELYQNQQIRTVMHKPVATGFQFGIGFALGCCDPRCGSRVHVRGVRRGDP